jgi:ATP-binding cassette subfamily B protein
MRHKESSTQVADGALYRRLLRLARPYTGHLSALLGLELLDGLLVLLTPLPLKIAIDSVLGSRPPPGFLRDTLPETVSGSATALLLVAVGLLLSVALLAGLQSLAGTLLRGYVGEQLLLGFRSQLFRHAQGLSLAYHDTQGTADTHYRIQKDAAAVQDLLLDSAFPLMRAALTAVLMFTATLWLDWQLGLVAVVVAPALLLLSGRYKRRLRQRSREVKALESGALAVVLEVLSALRVVKAFGQEDRERDQFVRHAQEGLRARLRLLLAEGTYGLAIRLTMALGTAAVLYLGITHVESGALTLGGLVLVLGYLALLYNPLKTISRKAGGLQSQLASAERAFALLDQRPDVDDRPGAEPLVRAAGRIEFRGVTFSYREGGPVLKGVSLAVAPGTRLGVVGATGAGKTTLLNLLMRFYDRSAGQVLLDGRDVRDYRLADLRNQFALVLQDPVLFSATVTENIAYGRPGATHAEVAAAARAACAHDFIARLPEGYATRVGERGMCLSGGERQRIALARAFLKDAPVLLLDEPTSAVDRQTEADILEALERLMRGRTCVLITHRESPLAACDKVLALEQGRLDGATSGELRPPAEAALGRPTCGALSSCSPY